MNYIPRVSISKILATFFWVSIYVALSTKAALANHVAGHTVADASPAGLVNPIQFDSLSEVLIAILDVLLILLLPIIVFFIILAGFQYVTARGNTTKVQDATRALTYALIGGAIVLGARIITEVIQTTITSIT